MKSFDGFALFYFVQLFKVISFYMSCFLSLFFFCPAFLIFLFSHFRIPFFSPPPASHILQKKKEKEGNIHLHIEANPIKISFICICIYRFIFTCIFKTRGAQSERNKIKIKKTTKE
ncbi:hypothetical protein, unlikely [Trypanosoma brucei gambiense DAL972]|uniref:Uncharacterized protein n=1 Tax=Trypanosoma brucei gambiense (strain MHOM/CI/86/DAL972) TaxID=679716 RepID=C9ZK42_TRYB9|nr:hypothetical protein, unlikely [Trypanosoma brucei gambiense DAL972]CBH09806.1 hypothetical protein, unlikely [Trypanosoma brucei gambiense DAL972]|eukprot:XP_011772099.1 hypothetical protein, unlikely [Trypanosoma brucei gambiense DAL972]